MSLGYQVINLTLAFIATIAVYNAFMWLVAGLFGVVLATIAAMVTMSVCIEGDVYGHTKQLVNNASRSTVRFLNNARARVFA